MGKRFERTVKEEVGKGNVEKSKTRLAEAYESLLAIKAEKAEANSDFNKQLKETRKEMRELVGVIRTGQREVTVECEERPNERRKEVEIVRCDTGQVVDSRPMTAEELQEPLFGKPKGNGKANGKRLDDGATRTIETQGEDAGAGAEV